MTTCALWEHSRHSCIAFTFDGLNETHPEWAANNSRPHTHTWKCPNVLQRFEWIQSNTTYSHSSYKWLWGGGVCSSSTVPDTPSLPTLAMLHENQTRIKNCVAVDSFKNGLYSLKHTHTHTQLCEYAVYRSSETITILRIIQAESERMKEDLTRQQFQQRTFTFMQQRPTSVLTSFPIAAADKLCRKLTTTNKQVTTVLKNTAATVWLKSSLKTCETYIQWQ